MVSNNFNNLCKLIFKDLVLRNYQVQKGGANDMKKLQSIRSNLNLGKDVAKSYYFLMHQDISDLQNENWLTEEHLLRIMGGWLVFMRLIQGSHEQVALWDDAPYPCDNCQSDLYKLRTTVTQRILGDEPIDTPENEAKKLFRTNNVCSNEMGHYLDKVLSFVRDELWAALGDNLDKCKEQHEEENIQESEDEVDSEEKESEWKEDGVIEEEIEAREREKEDSLSPLSSVD
jgi:hypothetical protein